LPQQTTTGFWSGLRQRLGIEKTEQLPATNLKIADDVRIGDYKHDFHTQLMAHYPYIEIGKRRQSLAMVVRVDDGQPLIRQQLESHTGLEIYHEMLSGFQPGQKDPDIIYSAIARRLTAPVKKAKSMEIGESETSKAVEQDLIFSIPPKRRLELFWLVRIIMPA